MNVKIKNEWIGNHVDSLCWDKEPPHNETQYSQFSPSIILLPTMTINEYICNKETC